MPEEICLGWLAMHCGHPVRWIEDRREHLIAGANCREHHYRITAYADRDGRLRGIDCEAVVDSGAYSSYPFSACLEAAQVASILPGPYDFPAYRCRTFSVATNKCPILPYRGVARTGVCFALELVLDAVAREAGIEPHEVRARNLVRPEQMPFDNITNKHFDSGDYPESLRRAVAAIDIAACASARSAASPTDAWSASALRPIASRRRTAPRSITAGASRWCPDTSRQPRGSRPTAAWSCASASIRTARAWKRRWRRSPMKCSGSIPGRSRSCSATPR